MQGKLKTAEYVLISSLHPTMRGINLVAKVVSAMTAVNKMRVDGSRVHIVEVTIADCSGSVIFRARNEQIAKLVIGKWVVIRNANIEMFRHTIRLVASKWAKLADYPDDIVSTPPPTATISIKPNMSEIYFDSGNEGKTLGTQG